jgi:hypothetical protein
VTAVGDTAEAARDLYARAESTILAEADRALRDGPMVG